MYNVVHVNNVVPCTYVAYIYDSVCLFVHFRMPTLYIFLLLYRVLKVLDHVQGRLTSSLTTITYG